MKKYNIEERINSVVGKHPDTVIKELQQVLEVGNRRLWLLRNATRADNTDAKGKQLAIIAKYFGCKVTELYVEKWFDTLPTIQSLNNAAQSAA